MYVLVGGYWGQSGLPDFLLGKKSSQRKAKFPIYLGRRSTGKVHGCALCLEAPNKEHSLNSRPAVLRPSKA